jgi:hypothetical protein
MLLGSAQEMFRYAGRFIGQAEAKWEQARCLLVRWLDA